MSATEGEDLFGFEEFHQQQEAVHAAASNTGRRLAFVAVTGAVASALTLVFVHFLPGLNNPGAIGAFELGAASIGAAVAGITGRRTAGESQTPLSSE